MLHYARPEHPGNGVGFPFTQDHAADRLPTGWRAARLRGGQLRSHGDFSWYGCCLPARPPACLAG